MNATFLDRRQAILGSAACVVGTCVIGCRPKPVTTLPSASATRKDIPLRIHLAGSAEDAEIIQRGWSSVSEQPIAITSWMPDRGNLSDLRSRLIDVANKSDIIVVPLLAVAELVAENSIVAFTGSDMQDAVDDLYPALRAGVARYAGEAYVMPIRSSLPAVFSSRSLSSTESGWTWKDYDTLVRTDWNGKAGEPIAEGWAATMFLWRAVGQSDRWLFNRENFQPLIEETTYVESLALMKETVDRYEHPRQTPADIWRRLSNGQCVGGITYPAEEMTDVAKDEVDLNLVELPSDAVDDQKIGRLLLDPWLPVIAISADCRQTDASRAFVKWISGGEGSRSTRQKIAPMSPVLASDELSQSGEYSQWSTSRLQSPLTTPSLQILSAEEYYASLQQQVMQCLDGKSSPSEALAETANAWREITKRVGVEKQLIAWRRAQGMRA